MAIRWMKCWRKGQQAWIALEAEGLDARKRYRFVRDPARRNRRD